MYKDTDKTADKPTVTDSSLAIEKKTDKSVPKKETDHPSDGQGGDLKSLIEKNIKWSQIIYEQNKKIKNRLTWMLIGDYLKIFLILAPLIIALLYLPPFISQLMKTYDAILPGQTGAPIGIMDELNKILQQNGITLPSAMVNKK
ncbi:MAG: hypothetical protein AAB390_00090 [Patescibacteria group bacterium]